MHNPRQNTSRRLSESRPPNPRGSDPRPQSFRQAIFPNRTETSHRRKHTHRGANTGNPRPSYLHSTTHAPTQSSSSTAEPSPLLYTSTVLPPQLEKASDQQALLGHLHALFQDRADKLAQVRDRVVPADSAPVEDYERRMRHAKAIVETFQEELEMLVNTYYAALQPVDDDDGGK